MTAKNNTKTKDFSKEMEKIISPVFVLNNKALKPYIELFQYQPENIYQQPLGSLVGFFEIKEYSEDSAYIVNFLTSVLKKEYYVNPKRSVTESLDSALHKVNVALSEIAKHGNINWLGKLDAAICVLEKNSIHFSVSGNAKIFLSRKHIYADISEDLAPDLSDPHPLKTFVNVSSGRLEEQDSLLITCDDIFHILTPQQIKKNIQRFSPKQFIQFLKTALGNEMEMTAAIVINIEKPNEEIEPAIQVEEDEELLGDVNVFSEKTFNKIQKSAKKNKTEKPKDSETEKIAEEQKKEYTDKKTGHIYVQGENNETNDSKWKTYSAIAMENIAEISFVFKSFIKKKSVYSKKQIIALIKVTKGKLAEQRKIQEEKRLQKEKEKQEKEESERIKREEEEKEKIKKEQFLVKQRSQPVEVPVKEIKETFANPELSIIEKDVTEEIVNNLEIEHPIEHPKEERLTLAQKIELAKLEIERPIKINQNESNDKLESYWNKQKENTKSKKITGKTFTGFLPHFGKIGKLFSRFSTKQKIYTVGAIFLIFIVPLIFIKISNRISKPQTTQQTFKEPTLVEKLSNEKGMVMDNASEQFFSGSASDLIVTDFAPFVVENSKLTGFYPEGKKEFQFPADSGNKIKSVFMKDLSLIFIITDQNKIISFSPISQQFKANSIQIDSDAQTSFFGTYLTYLYVLDTKSNQIWRYPRAEGGFGTKSSWLKEETNFSSASSMSMDENIYFTSKNQIHKLFKGKEEPISLEETNVPTSFDIVYTNLDWENLYILDKTNSRIIKFAKSNGQIVSQYYSENIKDALFFSVDEKTSKAYIGTSSQIFTIAL